MAKNSPISDSEWQEIVLHLLQQDPQQGIQATATVSADSSISILIRKSTQGITVSPPNTRTRMNRIHDFSNDWANLQYRLCREVS